MFDLNNKSIILIVLRLSINECSVCYLDFNAIGINECLELG